MGRLSIPTRAAVVHDPSPVNDVLMINSSPSTTSKYKNMREIKPDAAHMITEHYLNDQIDSTHIDASRLPGINFC